MALKKDMRGFILFDMKLCHYVIINAVSVVLG